MSGPEQVYIGQGEIMPKIKINISDYCKSQAFRADKYQLSREYQQMFLVQLEMGQILG